MSGASTALALPLLEMLSLFIPAALQRVGLLCSSVYSLMIIYLFSRLTVVPSFCTPSQTVGGREVFMGRINGKVYAIDNYW